MILGQLYYYHKVLDQFPFPVTLENLEKLEILGLEKLQKKDYQEFSQIELNRKIRDEFSAFFPNILKENKLNFSSEFWRDLSSPIISTNSLDKPYSKSRPKSDFQRNLLDWNNSGCNLDDLKTIIKEGEFLGAEEDLAILYGIKVLFLLSKSSENISGLELNLTNSKEQSQELSTESEILVITKNFFSPLFININCEFLLAKEDEDNRSLGKRIQEVLTKQSQIKLVLLAIEDLDVEEKVNWLQKYLPKEILVTSVDLFKQEQSENQTFFDKIVKKTLGVRLTS